MIDPYKIKEKDLPLIVLADDRRGLFGFLIKSHSRGNYNHIMEMHKPGYFATQDPTGYREIPVKKYLKSFIILKFWSIPLLGEALRKKWKEIIQADLNAPWVDRKYDYLGIIGQFLRIRWLNDPHLYYCSERVAKHLSFIIDIKLAHPTPSELNKYFKKDKRFKVYGRWFGD